MTRFLNPKWLLVFCAVLIAVSALAQQLPYKIIASKKTSDGRLNFVKFDPAKQNQISNESQTIQIKRILGLGSKHSFIPDQPVNSNPAFSADKEGTEHLRYNQFFSGIKVEYGVITLHSKNGNLNALTGDYFHIDDNFSTTPMLLPKAALDKAIAYMGAQKYSWQDSSFSNKLLKSLPKGELVICENFIEKAKNPLTAPKMELAYKFAIYAAKPLRYDYIYVSATSGNVILDNPIIKHADGTAATRYSGSRTIATTQLPGSNYILKDSGENYNIATYNMNRGFDYGSAANFADNDNDWTAAEYNNSNYDNAALDAHWGAMMTLDYWRTAHNRTSFDNNGSRINSYVHFGNLYANAFWDGFEMTYGDGDGFSMGPLTSVDICGHEIGHAVCQYTANLIYFNESGAMNEGFSDIWGACIKKYADPSKNIWLLADEISPTGTPIRSMSNPKSQGQPDTYLGINWFTGFGDNGGVHFNSGVLNFWFYLLTEGKSGTNDKGFAYNVSGIGMTKAAQIAYRAENIYLYPAAVYADARILTIQAAEDLFGTGSNEVTQTINAWDAVGVQDVLARPDGVTAVLDSNNVVVNWRYNTFQPVDGFKIERAINGNNLFATIATVGATERSFADTGYINNSINQYRLRSFIDTTHSDYSDIASVATGNAPLIMLNGSFTTCGNTFLDPGGLSNYDRGFYTETVSPATAGNKLKISFSQFNISYDYLYIYNGPTTSSPFLGIYTGTTLPPDLQSTAPGGELTFVFNTYNSNAYPGWIAYISCYLPVAAPNGLTAVADTLKNVHLKWNDNANDETHYIVERSLNDSLHFSAFATLPVNADSYDDANAPDNSYIYYRVRAYRDSTGSPYSNTVKAVIGDVFIMQNNSLTTCGVTFLDPGGSGNYNSGYYAATVHPAVAGNKLQIVFSQFNTAYDYLYIYDGPSNSYPLIGVYTGTTIPPVLQSSSPGGELTFIFNPYSSNYAPGWLAYISCFKPVAAPGNLTGITDTTGNVRLNWTDNASDETRYVVERSLNDSLNFQPIVTLAANKTSYKDTSAPDKSLLYYRVRAWRDSVGSIYSNTASVINGNFFIMKNGTVSTCGTTFLDPGGFGNYSDYSNYTTTFTPPGNGKKLKVVFNQFSTESCCDHLAVYDGPSTSSPLLGYFAGSAIPPEMESTGPNGELTFQFYADGSSTSSGWQAYVSCFKPVAKPTKLIATADSSSKIKLTWKDNANNETKYVVERSVNGSSKFMVTAQLPANTIQYTDSSAAIDNLLYYRVRAYRDTLGSLYSDTASVALGNAPFLMKDSTLITCDKVFMDPGGADVIPRNIYYYTQATFKPAVAGNNIKVVFKKFLLSGGYLNVYNGSSTSNPLLGSFNGFYPDSLLNFSGTGPDGSLTFLYQGSSYNDSGWVAMVSCYKPVARPTGLTAKPDTTGRIKLKWKDNANDETKYIIERSVNAPSQYLQVAELGPNTSQYFDNSAPANSLLYYRVRAFRDTLASFYSDTAAVAFGNAPFLMKDSTVVACDKVFLDPGGADVIPAGIYYYSQATFKPAVPGNNVSIVFSKFRINEYLAVYNGSSVNAPFIGEFNGLYPDSSLRFRGTGPDGSLTFLLEGYSYPDSGWEAQVSCYKPVAKPTGLTAKAGTAGSIKLKWNDNADNETKYIVERSVNALTLYSTIAVLPAGAGQYIDSSAPINSLLYYRVIAYQDTLASFYSDTASVNFGNAPFLMEDSTVITCDKVFMDPNGADILPVGSYQYKVATFRPAVSGNNIKVVFSALRINGNLSIYDGPSQFSPLIANLSGYYPDTLIFEATGAGGELTFEFSEYSYYDSGWLAHVSCYKPVTKPSGLTAKADTTGGIKLKWSDNANDETNYVVERSVNGVSQFIMVARRPANTTQYTDGTAPGNSRLYYRVRAYRDSIASLYSDTATVTFGNAPFLMKDSTLITCSKVFMDPGGADNVPGNIYYYTTATFKPAVAGNKIKVAFSKFNLSNTSLYVYSGSSTGGTFLASLNGYFPDSSISFEGAGTGGALTFLYIGYPSQDQGWVAQVSCFKPVARPTNLSAASSNPGHIKLAWNDNANDETDYVVERSADDSFHFATIVTLPANTVKYTDTSAPDNSIIYYRVIAYRDSTGSPYSNTATFINGDFYVMQNGTVSSCGTTFLDPGGFGNYSNYSNYTTTFTPSIAGKKIKVEFNEFNTESCCDFLRVYNGPNTSSNLLGSFQGSAIPPALVSSAANGELTFQFYSDGSATGTGWKAHISCVRNEDTLNNCSADSNDVNTISSNIYGFYYQWQKFDGANFVNIYDGGNYSGTGTFTLQVKNAGLTILEKFRCLANGISSKEYVIVKGNRWTGEVSSNWNNAQNWSCGTVPNANTDVLVEGGMAHNPVVSNNVECRSLRLLTGANLNISPGFDLHVLH